MKQHDIKKPIKKEDGSYDFNDCIDFLENKHQVKYRDWSHSQKHFNSWCDSKGYGKIDPSGKPRVASTIWYSEYKQDPKGEKVCPPYQDFWHFIISIHEIRNGKVLFLNYLKDQAKVKEKWQKDAYKLIHDEFGNSNGDIKFYFSW